MAKPPLPSPPDQELLLRQRQDEFVQLHLRRILLQIYRVVGNLEDAQDLTQEAFIKALQHQDQVKDLDKAAHWLSRIATNTAIDFLRRQGRASFSPMDELPEPLRQPEHETPERWALRGEKRDLMEQGLAQLTARERTALILRDIEGLPAEEVAARMSCSKATVRSHIANGRIKFRKFWERRGV